MNINQASLGDNKVLAMLSGLVNFWPSTTSSDCCKRGKLWHQSRAVREPVIRAILRVYLEIAPIQRLWLEYLKLDSIFVHVLKPQNPGGNICIRFYQHETGVGNLLISTIILTPASWRTCCPVYTGWDRKLEEADISSFLQKQSPSYLQQSLLYARCLDLPCVNHSYYKRSICKHHLLRFGNVIVSDMQLSMWKDLSMYTFIGPTDCVPAPSKYLLFTIRNCTDSLSGKKWSIDLAYIMATHRFTTSESWIVCQNSFT